MEASYQNQTLKMRSKVCIRLYHIGLILTLSSHSTDRLFSARRESKYLRAIGGERGEDWGTKIDPISVSDLKYTPLFLGGVPRKFITSSMLKLNKWQKKKPSTPRNAITSNIQMKWVEKFCYNKKLLDPYLKNLPPDIYRIAIFLLHIQNKNHL